MDVGPKAPESGLSDREPVVFLCVERLTSFAESRVLRGLCRQETRHVSEAETPRSSPFSAYQESDPF